MPRSIAIHLDFGQTRPFYEVTELLYIFAPYYIPNLFSRYVFKDKETGMEF